MQTTASAIRNGILHCGQCIITYCTGCGWHSVLHAICSTRGAFKPPMQNGTYKHITLINNSYLICIIEYCIVVIMKVWDFQGSKLSLKSQLKFYFLTVSRHWKTMILIDSTIATYALAEYSLLQAKIVQSLIGLSDCWHITILKLNLLRLWHLNVNSMHAV